MSAPESPAGDLPDFDRLWNYAAPAESEAKFRELLPRARAAADRSYLAQLLSQVARAQGLQRRFEAAHRTLDEVEGLLDGATEATRVRYLLERGRVFNDTGIRDRARALFLEAWELGRKAGADFHAVDAAHMVAIVEPPEQAMEWNRRALEYAERSADPRARSWRGTLYNNLGWTCFDRKEYAAALEYFRKSLDFFTAQKRPRPARIARWSIAKTLRVTGEVRKALELQEAVREEWERAGEEDGYVFEELGECLLALGREAEARPPFARAFALLSKDAWLAGREPARLERLRRLGEEK